MDDETRKRMTIGYGRDKFHPRTIERWDQIVEALGRCLVYSGIPEERRPPWSALDVTSCIVLTYHLVDFLEQYEGHDRDDLTQFVKAHPALSLCRDICINVKHAVMTHKPYTADGDKLEMTAESAQFTTGPGGTFHRVTIESEGTVLDAVMVARDAYFNWVEWGMPLQDHTRELWQLAERSEGAAEGVDARVISTPRPLAWDHDRAEPT